LNPVTFGVFLPSYAFQNLQQQDIFSSLKQVALECERLGYHSVWVDDHLMYFKNPTFECWTTLAALAAVTTKIRLGTMVTSNAFRNPALLAKMAANVDIVSGGRLEFGIGSGVQKQEHDAYGFPFPENRVRAERMGESLEIIKKLWTEHKATFRGKHYQVSEAFCDPKPIQKPHPPIIVGGSGEKYTLKVTAQHADRFDFGYLQTMDEYKRKLKVLENHCQDGHRKFREIQKSCWPTGQIIIAQNSKELEEKLKRLNPKGVKMEDFQKYTLLGTPDDCAARIQMYAGLGVTHFMLFFGDLPETGGLTLFAQTVAKNLAT
jgi:F420-dependent oxidoreductase-like protein